MAGEDSALRLGFQPSASRMCSLPAEGVFCLANVRLSAIFTTYLINHTFFNFSRVESFVSKQCFIVDDGFIPTFILKLVGILFSFFVNLGTYVCDAEPTEDFSLLVCSLELN